MRVFWGVLLERGMYDEAVASLMGIAYRAGVRGFPRILVPHTATEWAREEFTKAFREHATDPDDTLVMLDADHDHPFDIVERLALEPPIEYGVVAALAFCRGKDTRPAYFIKDDNDDINSWYAETEIPYGQIVPRDMVGTGAIAIKRWVFDKIESEVPGHPPFWKKMYNVHRGGEDWYFSLQCEKAGIARYVHCGLETPHFRLERITHENWEAFVKENLNDDDIS